MRPLNLYLAWPVFRFRLRADGLHMLIADLVVLLAVAAMVMLLLPGSRRWYSGRPGLPALERDFG